MQISREQRWGLAATVAAIAAGVAVRSITQSSWKKAEGRPPPTDPFGPSSWRTAVAWSAAIGALAGIARVLARSAVLETSRRREADRAVAWRRG